MKKEMTSAKTERDLKAIAARHTHFLVGKDLPAMRAAYADARRRVREAGDG
jgi:hypothetical protein